MIATDADLDEAMWAAAKLETPSRRYYRARTAGELYSLPDEEFAIVPGIGLR